MGAWGLLFLRRYDIGFANQRFGSAHCAAGGALFFGRYEIGSASPRIGTGLARPHCGELEPGLPGGTAGSRIGTLRRPILPKFSNNYDKYLTIKRFLRKINEKAGVFLHKMSV